MVCRDFTANCTVTDCTSPASFCAGSVGFAPKPPFGYERMEFMALPSRVHFTLHEVTARRGCNIADVAGWADAGRFRIMTGIGLVRCGEDIVAGQVAISPMDLLPLFRRCGTGPAEGVVRRIMTPEKGQWQIITDPLGGVTVAVADMMIMGEIGGA